MKACGHSMRKHVENHRPSGKKGLNKFLGNFMYFQVLKSHILQIKRQFLNSGF